MFTPQRFRTTKSKSISLGIRLMGLGVVRHQILELFDLDFGGRGYEHFSQTCRKETYDGKGFQLYVECGIKNLSQR